MANDTVGEMGAFDLGGVIYTDWRDRLVQDYRKSANTTREHWKHFTPEQQKKISDNAAPWLLSDAINNFELGIRERFVFSLREAYRAFRIAWRGSK